MLAHTHNFLPPSDEGGGPRSGGRREDLSNVIYHTALFHFSLLSITFLCGTPRASSPTGLCVRGCLRHTAGGCGHPPLRYHTDEQCSPLRACAKVVGRSFAFAQDDMIGRIVRKTHTKKRARMDSLFIMYNY